MNRRTFVVGAVGSLTIGSGCLGRSSSGNDEPATEGITSREFTITDSEPGGPFDDEPSVAFDPQAGCVTVTGKMWEGNPCMETTLETATYDESNETLNVTIGVEKTGENCPDSLGAIAYRAVVGFDDDLPKTVIATERPPDSWEPQTATIER